MMPNHYLAHRQDRISFLVWILALMTLALCLSAEKPEAVPNPRVKNGLYVQDNGGVLGPEYTILIDSICRNLKAVTGAELAVVTVADLGGMTIEEFAERLFRLYGIGEKGKDNGLLLLFSRDDRAVRIEVGYGLESVIPDAKASQLLDIHAVPYFKQGLIGRGLFLTAKETATAVASSDNVRLAIADPPSWPAQLAVPEAEEKPAPAAQRRWNSLAASLILAAGAFGLVAIGVFIMLLRFKKARARAERAKMIQSFGCFTALMWIAAFAGMFAVAALSGRFLPPLIAFLTAPTAATFGQVGLSKWLRRRLRNYHLSCRKCGSPMDLVPESEEHQLMSVEENAEESAGGMDYEFWKCSQCGESERLFVKLEKAIKCPKCGRRTLTTKRTTLVAATTSSGGRERVTETCKNPNCGFGRTVERSTPRLSSSSSSSSSGSHSSSSSGSFGGGSSGGGGASKHW